MAADVCELAHVVDFREGPGRVSLSSEDPAVASVEWRGGTPKPTGLSVLAASSAAVSAPYLTSC